MKASLTDMFNRWPRLAEAYYLKERFYDIYECENRAQAEAALSGWVNDLPGDLAGHFKEAATAVKNWRPHILRYFEHRYTNGYVEAMNGVIDGMNRAGRGYDFETIRAKVLLKYGARVIRLADGTISQDGMAPELEECGPGASYAWTGAPLSTLLADFEADAFEVKSTPDAG